MRSAMGSGERSGNDRSTEHDESAAVSVTDLEKVYGSGEDAVQAVDGVSFEIEQGSAVGILGPNGAGKTTIIKSLLSLVYPTDGSVSIHGIDTLSEQKRAHERIGAMLEGARNTYWRLTVRENLEIFSVIGGYDYRQKADRIDELLHQFDIAEKADTPVRELSRGQKQKVSLAVTMVTDPDVVVLDEPALGLDVESSLELRQELRRLVEDEGTTIIVSSHDMDIIQNVCDRVIILNNGNVVADDTIDNLLEMFRTQLYNVTVDEDLTETDRRRLEATATLRDVERQHDRTTFTVQVSEDQFYEFIDALRCRNLTVTSIDAAETDLEEIFLDITDDLSSEQTPAGATVSQQSEAINQ